MEQQDALDLFAKDLKYFEDYLNRVLRVPLTQDQFDALLDFVFNAGSLPELSRWTGRLKECVTYSPTNPRCQDVLFQINCGVFDNVFGKANGKSIGLSRFNRPGTAFEKGLTKRRSDEETLWNRAGGERLAAHGGPAGGVPPRPKPLPSVGPRAARVSVGAVRAGKTTTVRGTRFGLPKQGCKASVRLWAFATGVSPYRTIALGRVAVGKGGAFTRKWKTPKAVYRFRWVVVAFQACGGKTMQRRAYVMLA
jgi:hypothetical protein